MPTCVARREARRRNRSAAIFQAAAALLSVLANRHRAIAKIDRTIAAWIIRDPQNALRPMKPRTTVIRMILMSNQKLQFCM